MKLRATVKYQLYSCILPLAIFYGVLFLLNVLSAVLASNPVYGGSVSGLDSPTTTFLFILGLNLFKEPFRFLALNGRTRRTACAALALSALALAALAAAADVLLHAVFAPLLDNYISFYGELYGEPQTAAGVLVEFGWRAALYSGILLTGLWIAALYYRMKKPVKIAVSVGVPALLMFALAEVNVGHGVVAQTLAAIVRTVTTTFRYILGFGGETAVPARFCLWGFLLALAAAGLLWACMRRAEVRE